MKTFKKSAKTDTEVALYQSISALINASRQSVSRGIDLIQVRMNFEIGRHIVKHEQQGETRADYAKTLVKNIAERLSEQFGRGFSKTNLEYMRRFYLLYQARAPFLSIAQTQTGQLKSKSSEIAAIAQSQTGQSDKNHKNQLLEEEFRLSWTHYVFLIGIKNEAERSFYEIEADKQDWNVRELKRQFESSLYERLALSRDKKGILKLAQEGQIVNSPKDVLKEPLVLEFLGLSEQTHFSEDALERAIIDKIEHFLLELGKGFLFEARQKRFSFDADHFFVDLVFYNRLLRCYVLIDLKLGKLTHQDLGQMQMYVNYFDRHVKTTAENNTVGIVLCKKKHEALVEITLPKESNIHAREYQLCLPSKDDLREKLIEWSVELEK